MIKAVEVERAVFTEYSGDGTSVTDGYKKQIRMLFANLKNKQQAGMLGKKVLMGAISADDFAKADAESLKSEALKKLEVKLKEENMKNAQVPMAEKSISTALECGKCKKKLVSYTQAQTRSADEPMTTFCECTNCGNRWKVSAILSVGCEIAVVLTCDSSPELRPVFSSPPVIDAVLYDSSFLREQLPALLSLGISAWDRYRRITAGRM